MWLRVVFIVYSFNFGLQIMEKFKIGNQKNLAIKIRSTVLPSNVRHAHLINLLPGGYRSAYVHSFNFLLNIEIHNELEL